MDTPSCITEKYCTYIYIYIYHIYIYIYNVMYIQHDIV